MNRLVSRNLEQVSPDNLPPLRRQGPARILFINSTTLGFSTQAQRLRDYAGRRDDIDAVHIDLAYPWWVRLLGKSLPAGGWDLHTYRYLRLYRGILRRWLRGPLHTARFDVIHWMTQGIALAMVDVARGPAPRPRQALYVDCTAALETRAFGKAPLALALFARCERRMFAAADVIECMSRWTAQSVRTDYAVAQERILMAPGCVALNTAAVPRQGSAADDGRRLRIIFIGSSWKLKRGPELVRLHQQRWADRAELHIVSGGATPLPGARNVIWHGAVERPRLLADILPRMDLLVCPTRQDTFLWAALEAAAAGIPAVASRLGGIPEIVLNGVSGLLVDRDDMEGFAGAVDRLLIDGNLRRRMGQAAMEHMARNFNPQVVYGALMDSLVKLAENVK